MTFINNRSAGLLAAAGLVVGVAACGGDPQRTGEVVIETELAEQLGVGDLEASCDQPPDREVGTTYDCTATTEDGRTLTFLSRFTEEDRIFVQPSNVLSAAEIPVVVEQAAAIIGPEVGVEIDPASIECPSEEVNVLGDGGTLDCTIARPDDGVVFPFTITLENFEFDEGFQNLFVEIGEEPVS